MWILASSRVSKYLPDNLGQLKLADPALSTQSTPPTRTSVPADISITTSNLKRRQSRSKLPKPQPPTTPATTPVPVKIVRRQKTGTKDFTPNPPGKTLAAVYVAVYEAEGVPREGFTRQFMRHSSIVVQPYYNINQFFEYHVKGKPLERLTYEYIVGRDPRESMRNLSFDLVARIPRSQLWDLDSLFRESKPRVFQVVKGQPSKSWNSQMFVQECLHKMVAACLMTNQEMKSAIEKQQRAVSSPWSGEFPNLDALSREHSDVFVPWTFKRLNQPAICWSLGCFGLTTVWHREHIDHAGHGPLSRID